MLSCTHSNYCFYVRCSPGSGGGGGGGKGKLIVMKICCLSVDLYFWHEVSHQNLKVEVVGP